MKEGGRAVKMMRFCALAIALNTVTFAQECPPGPNKITVDVTALVTYSSTTKLYTYSYTLTSSSQSLQLVDSFTIMPAGEVVGLIGPAGWPGHVFAGGTALQWAPMEPEPLPPGVEDDGSMPAPLHGIKPGTTLSGFSFQSALPPGPRPYYISGFAPPPGQASEEEAESFLDRCPEFGQDYFQYSVRGSVQGPTNVRTIQIDILPGNPANNFDPRSTGVITVALLAGKGFNIANIDIGTASFGRGEARPTGSYMQDVNNDGKPDLVLQYNIPASMTACQDVAAFLMVKDGDWNRWNVYWGSDSISTGCR